MKATEFLQLCSWDMERAVHAMCAAMLNREEIEIESVPSLVSHERW